MEINSIDKKKANFGSAVKIEYFWSIWFNINQKFTGFYASKRCFYFSY